MGVTIHFEGQLQDDAAYDAVLLMAAKFAAHRGWKSAPIQERVVTLKRVKDEQDWDYEGPTRGLEIWPHEHAEPVRLEFDKDLYVQELTKTQFAPIEIHIEIIQLLKELASQFRTIGIVDEGEYFETGSREVLELHFDRFFEVFHEELAKSDECRGPVKLPSGRIADLVSNR